jgi:hypothetical protein
VGKRTKTFEENIKEHIRRGINNPETRGTERLKYILAGIKLLHLEKITGSQEHGTGFDTIDRDDDDETADELTEEGARDEHDTNGSGGGPAA